VMTSTMLKGTAVVSSVGLALLAQIPVDPMAAGERLGQSTLAGALGVVSVVCILAVVYLFRAKEKSSERHHAAQEKQQEALHELVRETTKAVTKAAEKEDHICEALRDVKTSNTAVIQAVQWCKDRSRSMASG